MSRIALQSVAPLQPLKALAALVLLALALPASAVVLVDTGTPDGSRAPLAVDASNFVALQFTAAQPWRIDAASAYLTGGGQDAQFALVLYQDAAGRPGDELAFTMVTYANDGWNTATGLGWQLPAAGSYWLSVEGLALEQPANSGLWVPQGAFAAPGGGLLMPGATAFNDGSGFQAYAGLQIGAQLVGAVPEPASAGLLLAGLGLLVVAARRAPQRPSASDALPKAG